MKTGIYLSYVGLGANLLHLSYCHQIAKKYGPVTIITSCKNLEAALADDPLIEKVFYLNQNVKIRLAHRFYTLCSVFSHYNFTQPELSLDNSLQFAFFILQSTQSLMHP